MRTLARLGSNLEAPNPLSSEVANHGSSRGSERPEVGAFARFESLLWSMLVGELVNGNRRGPVGPFAISGLSGLTLAMTNGLTGLKSNGPTVMVTRAQVTAPTSAQNAQQGRWLARVTTNGAVVGSEHRGGRNAPYLSVRLTSLELPRLASNQ